MKKSQSTERQICVQPRLSTISTENEMTPGQRELIALLLLVGCIVILILYGIQAYALEKRITQVEADIETLFILAEDDGASREVLRAIRQFNREVAVPE